MRSDNPLDGLQRAAQRDDQLERRAPVGITGGCRRLLGSRGHDI